MSFDAAVRRLQSKTPVASKLTSAQWAEINLGLSDRAFFSARVDDIRTLAGMQSRIDDALTLTRRDGGAFMDRSRFIADMRSHLGAAPGDSGSLSDLTSAKRLGLIYDFNTEDAMEYGRWLARQDPDILAAFPCSELIRVEHREVPRGYRKGAHGRLIEVPDESWPARWAAAGGEFVGGRMIALKGDPIWVAISRFGRPWPPFDFNSGMGIADVSYDLAVELGVIAPDSSPPAPEYLDFNHNLQATIPEATPATLEGFKNIFGDQVEAGADGKIVWQGQRIAKLYEAALTAPSIKWSVDLGAATPEAIAAAEAVGSDLTDARLIIQADEIRHAEAQHGVDESRADQRPIRNLDFQLIPHVWRDPDSVVSGDRPGTLLFSKEIIGRSVLVVFAQKAKSPRWGFLSLFVKKNGGTP